MFLVLTQCCGSASFWCRSGSDFPFWCQSRYGSYTKFYTCWKISNFSWLHSSASFHCFIFLLSVSGAIILNHLDNISKFSGKKKGLALNLVETDMNPFQLRIRICRPWMPVRIWMWIRQNNADPTGSGSKTLFLPLTGGNLAVQMGVHNQLSLLRHLSKKRAV